MKTFVIDDVPPEANAMLQALYSRSSKSVELHLETVRSRGAESFMSSYYIGYGHASIGDCGQTTMFIEGVSLLACKAVQDNPLYSGQETSTRYIDFSKQEIINPTRCSEFAEIQHSLLDFYLRVYEKVFNNLKEKFPCAGGSKKTWEKTLSARAFDVARGFLPAGVSTQLSWTASLRQANEGVVRLLFHPLAEVRQIATRLKDELLCKYPSSFAFEVPPENQEYLEAALGEHAYARDEENWLAGSPIRIASTFDRARLTEADVHLLRSRPRKAALPRHFAKYGRFSLTFELDFGSFRDLQRHRNGFCAMPLLSDRLGFNRWYIEQLPQSDQVEAESFLLDLLRQLSVTCDRHEISAVERQYALPMGMNVLCELEYDLPQLVYVTELRSGTTVHPTLRAVTHAVHEYLASQFAGMALYTNLASDVLDIRRGAQDIVCASKGREVA